METNFFKQIAEMNITGDLQIFISKGAENNLIVSTMLLNSECGDNAKKSIIPINLRGTAQELDEGYFKAVTTPIQTASGLMVNMEAFLKQLEQAKARSAMEKEKTDREKKAKEEKERKFKEAIQKLDALEKEGKYRDAWMKVPYPLDYPEQAEALRNRRSALSAKFAPDLFSDTETDVPQQVDAPVFSNIPTNKEMPDDDGGEDSDWDDSNEEEEFSHH